VSTLMTALMSSANMGTGRWSLSRGAVNVGTGLGTGHRSGISVMSRALGGHASDQVNWWASPVPASATLTAAGTVGRFVSISSFW
jgi:hypothetical protein